MFWVNKPLLGFLILLVQVCEMFMLTRIHVSPRISPGNEGLMVVEYVSVHGWPMMMVTWMGYVWLLIRLLITFCTAGTREYRGLHWLSQVSGMAGRGSYTTCFYCQQGIYALCTLPELIIQCISIF